MRHGKRSKILQYFGSGLIFLTFACQSLQHASIDKDRSSQVKVDPNIRSSYMQNSSTSITKNYSTDAKLNRSTTGITTDESSFFLTIDHAITLIITPNEQSQSVTCTIIDCTTTVIKPISINSGSINFFIGTATITATYKKVSQKGVMNGQPVDEAHATHSIGNVATFSPIALGNILNLGVTLTTNLDHVKKPERPKGKIENFSCKIQFGCRIPSLYLYIGADFRGLQIGAEVAPSLTADDQATLSTEIAHYKGHIDYIHIPQAIMVNLLNAAEYTFSTRSSIPEGRFADDDWNEFIDYYRDATHTKRRSNPSTAPAY